MVLDSWHWTMIFIGIIQSVFIAFGTMKLKEILSSNQTAEKEP